LGSEQVSQADSSIDDFSCSTLSEHGIERPTTSDVRTGTAKMVKQLGLATTGLL
jgi:hypothetical protein